MIKMYFIYFYPKRSHINFYIESKDLRETDSIKNSLKACVGICIALNI